MNVGADHQAWTTASLGSLPHTQGSWRLAGLSVSLAPLVGSKLQMEDQGEVGEEGGHLYDHIKMVYEEDFCPESVLTQGMEDAIVLVSNLSPFLSEAWIFLSPNSPISHLIWPFALWFENTRIISSRMRNWCGHRRRKFRSWWPYDASLPIMAEEATLLWAAGVPNPDATVIAGVTTSSSEDPGTSTGGITPKGPRICIGVPAPPPCWITHDFLHPLALPADFLTASDWDSASNTKLESNSSNHSRREHSKSLPPPSDFQDVSQNPSLGVAYRDLVPMIRLLPTWLPISEGDWRHHYQGCQSTKDYNCLVEGCGMWFTNKELANSHIWVAHSHMGLFCPWVG